MRKILFATLLCIIAANVNAQSLTKIRGKVTDATTKEALPFVNICFKGTTIGTITDFEGNYYLQAKSVADTLEFSMMGYKQKFISVKKGSFQEINIELETDDLQLDEIVVLPGENPAWAIMRKIEENRKKNNPDHLDGYKYEAYNKIELDINNVKNEWTDKKIFKNFDFVFNYADTSAETGKVYLPVFITENISEVNHKSSPQRMKEIVKASRISGVEDGNLSQYTGQMYLDVNIYNNYIPAFGHDFVSPVSDFWKANYKYYLLDSSYVDGKYLYHISFKPKYKQNFTFTGEFWVNDTTFAIQKIKARMSDGVNINYIKDMIVNQEFTYIDSTWFLNKEDMFIDFNLTDKTTGLFGRKTMTRKNISINPDFGDNFFSASASQESIIEEDANKRDSAYWNGNRHEKLTQKEADIYAMVDSIKEVPIFNTFVNTVDMLINGYWVFKWFEYGPYFKTYSHNPIEGHRFRVGGRTSNNFSTDVMINGYLAYGTTDEKLKYGLGALYMFNKMPRRTYEIQYKYDYEQLGQSINAFTEDNILSTVLARSPNNHLLLCQELKMNWEYEYFQGLMNNFELKYRKLFPSDIIPFKNEAQLIDMKNITSYEISLLTHFAYNEKFVAGEFLRKSKGSDYPIFDLTATVGFWNNNNSYNRYYRFIGTISQNVPINPLGKMHYIIEGGKIFGTLPFPLLKLHEGNETYVFDSYAFNLMNLYEFASDTYLSATLEHHFNGFFLNRIPLLRKLKWREIAYAKGLVGNISDKNSKVNALLDFPSTLGNVNKPYLECGVGIENIFKFFRIDYVRRLTYLDNPGISKYAILLKAQIII